MNEDQLAELINSVKRIEIALIGDEDMGQMGLIKQVRDHHLRIKRLEAWVTGILACATLIGVFYKVATDWWPKK